MYLLKSPVTLSVHLSDLTGRASMIKQFIEAAIRLRGSVGCDEYMGQMLRYQSEASSLTVSA